MGNLAMSMDEDRLPPRIVAIDPGKKRIGVAISDPFGNFAVGLDTIANHAGKDLIPELSVICRQYEVARIVMGLPLHMSGEEGESARFAREMAAVLEAGLGIPIDLMDERLTSKIAEQSLRDMGIQSSRHRAKGIIDQAAAMRILQDYLDRQKKHV
jgi:putative Holliday junction resolvase